MPRPEGSGRKAGTPNRRTKTVLELVEASGKCPIQVMLDLLDDSDPALKLAAAKELAQYCYPKRRHLDVDATSTSVVLQPQTPVTDEQLELLVSRARGELPGRNE